MTESSPEAERVDESAYGAASSREADVAAGGVDIPDVGPEADADEGADEAVEDSHAADIDAGFDDASDSPTLGGATTTEDGSL